MTPEQINKVHIELWQGIAAIADNDELMAKLTKYVKKLAKQKEPDPTLFTKEVFFRRIDEAKKGPSMSFAGVEELDEYIQSL